MKTRTSWLRTLDDESLEKLEKDYEDEIAAFDENEDYEAECGESLSEIEKALDAIHEEMLNRGL